VPCRDADAVADAGIDATAADDADIHAAARGNGHISC
jgi:hypothetical protein